MSRLVLCRLTPFPEKFNVFLNLIDQAASTLVAHKSAWKNFLSSCQGSASIEAHGDQFRALFNLAAAPGITLLLLFIKSLPAASLSLLAPVPLWATLEELVELVGGVLTIIRKPSQRRCLREQAVTGQQTPPLEVL